MAQFSRGKTNFIVGEKIQYSQQISIRKKSDQNVKTMVKTAFNKFIDVAQYQY
jgi:hypothetical protein